MQPNRAHLSLVPAYDRAVAALNSALGVSPTTIHGHIIRWNDRAEREKSEVTGLFAKAKQEVCHAD
jgi:hypothetical protein